MSEPIYHLVPAEYFYSLPPGRPYVPREFGHDGFIHCTAGADTLLAVANQWLAGTPGDFLVLIIDPDKLTAPLKWEAPAPPLRSGEAAHGPGVGAPPAGTFPHVYGPLNRDAITDIRRMRRHTDGTFEALDKSLPLHARERETFLTPTPDDSRTLPVDALQLLRRFEQIEESLDNARGTLAEQLSAPAPAGGYMGRMMRDTLTHIADLDRQIDYYFTHGTLQGYETPPPRAAGETAAALAPDDELAQLRASAEDALADLAGGSLDGATTHYVAALALSALIAAFFLMRGEEPPAAAQALTALETRDAEAAGLARAVLTVAEHHEVERLLQAFVAHVFATPAARAQPPAGPENDSLQPAPD
jgi:uncharacterized protein (DUF952 family)